MNVGGFLHDLLRLLDTFGDVWPGDIEKAMVEHGLLERGVISDEPDAVFPSAEFKNVYGLPEELADWHSPVRWHEEGSAR
jgi:hypothetical protein